VRQDPLQGEGAGVFGHQPQHCNHLIRLGIAKTQVIFRMHIDLVRPIPRESARAYQEHYKRGKRS